MREDSLKHSVTTGQIVDSALMVHSELGPGLLEAAYVACLAFELRSRSLRVETEVALPVRYRGELLGLGYRIDLLVDNAVVVEVKAVVSLHRLHFAQLLSYLRLSGKTVGLLINFHEPHLRDGIKRLVWEPGARGWPPRVG